MSYHDETRKKVEEKAKLVLYLDAEGNTIHAEPYNNECKIAASGTGDYIPVELIQEKGNKVKILPNGIVYVYSSPGCYIPLVTGGWICICCP